MLNKLYFLPTECSYLFCKNLIKTLIIFAYDIDWLDFITERVCLL